MKEKKTSNYEAVVEVRLFVAVSLVVVFEVSVSLSSDDNKSKLKHSKF